MPNQYGCRVSAIIDRNKTMLRYSTRFGHVENRLVQIMAYPTVGEFYIVVEEAIKQPHTYRWKELRK
jgi:hypothetical protein